MKRILLFFALLFAAAPALAAEHAGSGNTPTLESGWTGTNFTNLHASSVWNKRAYKADTQIIEGHTYRFDLTATNVSGSGSVQVYVGGPHPAPPSLPWVNAPNIGAGENDILSNFNVASALTTVAAEAREPDPNGSFRFKSGYFFSNDDPVVYPCLFGKSHTHMVWGNTGFNACSTFKSLRTTGGTTAGRSATPVDRAVYWTAAMIGGGGEIRNPYDDLHYYKVIGNKYAECGAPTSDSDPNHVGICSAPFRGLRWLWGCNMATMTNCPASGFVFHCMNAAPDDRTTVPATINVGHPNGEYDNLDDLVDAASGNCPVLKYDISSPGCWDGQHLDSPNHQAHVAAANRQVALDDPSDATNVPGYAGIVDKHWGGCPTSHPYLLPTISSQFWFKTDASFFLKKWHLSCDEQMNMSGMKAGQCAHFDYWEAWDQSVYQTATEYCFNQKNSSNGMELCDGTQVIGVTGPNANTPPTTTRSRVGWSKLYSGNGHWIGELKAINSGELGLNAVGGLTGDFNLSVTDVTNVGVHTGVTVQN